MEGHLQDLFRRHPLKEEEASEDFKIDIVLHRATVRGQVIHLSPLEFDLLRCFVEHSGQTLTHRAIFQYVWGIDDEGRVHIRAFIEQLRKKIEYSQQRRYIVTESSSGYRFCASGQSVE